MLPEGEGSALARSLPGWPVFDDVRPGLTEAHDRGWKLGILSNTDRDLIDASMEAIGVPVRARRSSPARSARTSRRTGTGRSSTRRPEPIDAGTSTSRRASSTTSRPRASSGSRRSGSTASASPTIRGRTRRSPASPTSRTRSTRSSQREPRARAPTARRRRRRRAADERALARAGRRGFRAPGMVFPGASTSSTTRGSSPTRTRTSSSSATSECGSSLRGSPTADACRLGRGAGERAGSSGPLRRLGRERVRPRRASRGADFRLVRHSHRMTIELDAATAAPVWPEGIEVRTFRDGDERALLRRATGDVRGHLGADRRAVRRVGALAARGALLRSRAVVPRAGRTARPAGFAICQVHPGDRRARLGADSRRSTTLAWPWPRSRAPASRVRRVPAPRTETRGPRRRRREPDRRERRCTSRSGMRAVGALRASTRRSLRELAARPLPELPHVHRGRGRRRLRVPQLREHVRGGARARSCGVGLRRRGDGRGRARRASVSGGRRRRARHARRAERGGRRGACSRGRSSLGGCCCAHVGAATGSPVGSTGSASSGSTRTAT